MRRYPSWTLQLTTAASEVSEKFSRGPPECQGTATLYTAIYTGILKVKQRDLQIVSTFTLFYLHLVFVQVGSQKAVGVWALDPI